MTPWPPDLCSCTRTRWPGKATQHGQELHCLLNRLNIIVCCRRQTITPDKNTEPCSTKRLEGILIRLIVANIDREHARR